MTSALHGLLWDMDGTSTDSAPLWDQAIHSAAQDLSVDWTTEELAAVRGHGMWAVAARFRALGAEHDPPWIVDRIERHALDLVEHVPLSWLAGVREVLEECRREGVACALVTMTGRDVVAAILARLGPGLFDAVVSGGDVTAPKPAPDPYLRGLEILGLDAVECLAIEDSLVGASSATAAGLATVIVSPGPGVMIEGRVVQWDTMAGRTLDSLRVVHADLTSQAMHAE